MKLNTAQVAALRPDYLGFIFWEPSSRFFDGEVPELPMGVQKVGVFVDASIDDILEKVDKYGLHAVQLHGTESPEYCEQLQKKSRKLNARSTATHDRQKATNAGSSIASVGSTLPAGVIET
ncbi:MAG: hypothetical protein WBG48_16900, partial [Pricia sp.]